MSKKNVSQNNLKFIRKTIYFTEQMEMQIEQLVVLSDTSFSSVVVNMVEYCLRVEEETE